MGEREREKKITGTADGERCSSKVGCVFRYGITALTHSNLFPSFLLSALLSAFLSFSFLLLLFISSLSHLTFLLLSNVTLFTYLLFLHLSTSNFPSASPPFPSPKSSPPQPRSLSIDADISHGINIFKSYTCWPCLYLRARW